MPKPSKTVKYDAHTHICGYMMDVCLCVCINSVCEITKYIVFCSVFVCERYVNKQNLAISHLFIQKHKTQNTHKKKKN